MKPVAVTRQDSGSAARRRRIVVFTCRDSRIDFRLPLAKELQALGNDVLYVWLRRRPAVTHLARPEQSRQMSLMSFVQFAWRNLRRSENLVVLNSTNLALPGFTLMLQAIIGGAWCFDLHDDLLYDRRGVRRIIASWWQAELVRRSDLSVHAAPLLSELFPRSLHLGNASSMSRMERRSADFSNILVLASIDDRFDFDFVRRAAVLNPALRFAIHGHALAPGAASLLNDLTNICPNISYAGAYENQDLPVIMTSYSVTLAPYVTNSRLTRYIDPLRYYHCLNSGMELISTDIPRARDFGDRLHIVACPEEFGGLVDRLAQSGTSRKNAGSMNEVYTWRARAVRFIEILEDVERRALLNSRLHARRS